MRNFGPISGPVAKQLEGVEAIPSWAPGTFMKYWMLCLGKVGTKSIILTRDKNHKLHAFYNTFLAQNPMSSRTWSVYA